MSGRFHERTTPGLPRDWAERPIVGGGRPSRRWRYPIALASAFLAGALLMSVVAG